MARSSLPLPEIGLSDKASAGAVVARRSQPERSAATQAAAINAAIAILHEVGYAACSTTLVQSRSGLSRGAMLHQFPTKAKLMAAVLEHVFALHQADYARALGPISDPRGRLLALPRVAWSLFKEPPSAAQLEITLAARSDPDLAAAVEPVRQRVDETARKMFGKLVHAAGVRDEAAEGLFGVTLSAVRGLQAQWIVAPSEAPADQTLAALERLIFAEITRADMVRLKKTKRGSET